MSAGPETIAEPASTAPALAFPASFTLISDEVSQDLEVVGKFVRDFRLSGIELRSAFGRAFKDLTDADIAEVASFARSAGWRIHGCSTPVFKCAIDDAAAIREHLNIFKRSLDTARTLDCNLVRVFTFLRRPQPLDDATASRIAGHLHQLAEIARGSGVRIGVENESSCIIATEEELLRIIPLLPGSGFGIIWDPCNALYVPEAQGPVGRRFAEILPSIIHIHIKDALRREQAGGQYTADAMPVGLGDIGWRGHFGEIKRSGYRGMLSLETHWRTVQIDEHLLHLPAGHAFSKGGEEASRTCFGNIQALWSSLG
jgi:sugar phosphate isomerase/epimerase